MFTYLISPVGNHTPVLLAFTINNNTITGYVKTPSIWDELWELIPFTKKGLSFSRISAHFEYCLSNYTNIHTHLKQDPVIFVTQDDTDHLQLHSNEIDETEIVHYHLKHSTKVDIHLLTNFLIELDECNKFKNFNNDQPFITEKVRNDIIKKFKKYSTNSSLNKVTGNNPEYLALPSDKPLPTITEHEKCLMYSQSTGCTADNPLSPQHLRLPAPNSEVNSYGAIGAGILLGTLVFGIFALNNRKPIPKEQINELNAKKHQL